MMTTTKKICKECGQETAERVPVQYYPVHLGFGKEYTKIPGYSFIDAAEKLAKEMTIDEDIEKPTLIFNNVLITNYNKTKTKKFSASVEPSEEKEYYINGGY